MADNLNLRIWTKPGTVNLAMLEGIGREANVERDRADGTEVIVITMPNAGQIPIEKWTPILKLTAESLQVSAKT